MYTKELLLEKYNEYLLDEDIYDKDPGILKNRQYLLDVYFPLPSPPELEKADNKLKEVIKDLHKKTLDFYEYVKPILEDFKDWSIESVFYPIFEEDSRVINILGTDYNPMFRPRSSILLDNIRPGHLEDLEKTELQLFGLTNENDSWGDFDLPRKIRGTYLGLHISQQFKWFRTRFYSFSDFISIPGYNTDIIFSNHVSTRIK